MLSHKMDFNCCANRDGFCKSSHKYVSDIFATTYNYISAIPTAKRTANTVSPLSLASASVTLYLIINLISKATPILNSDILNSDILNSDILNSEQLIQCHLCLWLVLVSHYT